MASFSRKGVEKEVNEAIQKYNYKRRRNNGVWKFIASLLVGIIASCMIGLGVAWIVWKVSLFNDFAQVGADNN